MTNVIWEQIGQGTIETLQMTLASTLLAYLFGTPIGILLAVTGKGGLLEKRSVYTVVGTIVNIFRSIPFLILLVFLIPFTRWITGSSIGTVATIVPLTVGAIPIVARMVESSLNEVAPGIIEAAMSMGASPMQVIIHFILPETAPSLVMGIAINMVTILGYSAMAGCIGGGGLGAIALNYGYYRYQTNVLLITIVLLIAIVQIFQEIGIKVSKHIRH